MGGGSFDAYTVTSPSGPHVTLQAGVVHLGRHWTTTTRRSAKAASIRRVGRATATVRDNGRWRVIGGEASVLDLRHPSTIAVDLLSSAGAAGALFRLGLGRVDQLIGYAEAGTAIPASFLPSGRVLLVTRIRDELVLDHDQITKAKGRWAALSRDLTPPIRPAPRRRVHHRRLRDVPQSIAALAGQPGRGWLGVTTTSGAVALPAAWDPDRSRIRVGRRALAAVAALLPGPACLTLHDSHRRRPDEKIGVMLRGEGTLIEADDTGASIVLRVERVTHWCGFASSTSGQFA